MVNGKLAGLRGCVLWSSSCPYSELLLHCVGFNLRIPRRTERGSLIAFFSHRFAMGICQSSKSLNRVEPTLSGNAQDAATLHGERASFIPGRSGKEYVTFVSHYKLESATDGK